MFEISPSSLLLAIVLQFAVATGVYAFGDDAPRHWQPAPTTQINRIELGVYQISQNEQGSLRSRSDVIQEVKRRYNAEVLKISLDERQQVYRVRVLMPNGKVRNLKINARR